MNKLQLENLFDSLFPLTRSISGNGLRKSLRLIADEIPLKIIEYPTGMKCFDWEIPLEWNISKARINSPDGKNIVDFKKNNLHVLGYSEPFSGRIFGSELKNHMYSIEDKPNAIPFVTSYYERRWGFCVSHNELLTINDDAEYDVKIESTLEPGSVTIGECIIKGRTKKEIILFSHIGHPSMANDQLSGPLTVVALAKWLIDIKSDLKYSYRIILAPETIGSISYIYNNLKTLKRNVKGGYTLACTADRSNYNYRRSKPGNSVSDDALVNALKNSDGIYSIHDFSPLGCDERHFNSPGISLPIGCLMRSIPGTYPEYHTSLDNKDFISFDNLLKSIKLMKDAIKNIEADAIVSQIHKHCEPKLDKHGLYPTLSNKNDNHKKAEELISLWAFADGSRLSNIADRLGTTTYELRESANLLADKKIIRIKEL